MIKAQVKKVLFAVALLVFLGGIYFSLKQQPDILRNLYVLPALLGAFVIVPCMLALNGFEFQCSVRLLCKKLPFIEALETTVIGGAANMLPIPGSAMVKVVRMKALGVSYKQSVSLTILLAVFWLVMVVWYAGVWLAIMGHYDIGLLMAISGAIALTVSFGFAVKFYGSAPILAQILLVRFTLVLFDAALLFLCFAGLGQAATIGQTSVLTLSGFLGAAVSVIPAGLGAREIVSAGIGPLIGLTAAATFLASALGRILSLSGIAFVSVGFLIRNKVTSG